MIVKVFQHQVFLTILAISRKPLNNRVVIYQHSDILWGYNLKDKKKKIIVISVLIICLIIFSITAYFVVDFLIEVFKPYENGLEIRSDADFINLNLPGTGTEADPHIIANYEFSEKLVGILISNTTKHFIITNCTMTNFFTGIEIQDVSFGTCEITNNSITNGWWPETGPYHGIKVNSSDGVVISENTIRSAGLKGIVLISSNECLVEENTISLCYAAINLENCYYTTIISNSLIGFGLEGITVLGSEYTQITGNRIQLVDEKGIVIMDSSFSTISENTIINENDGASVRKGVGVYGSNNLTIFNNSIAGFGKGIHFENSDLCSIISNSFNNNTNFAVYLDASSDSNILYYNSFTNNSLSESSQGFDDGNSNFWFSSTLMQGNYWDTWIGGNYEIAGLAGTADIYPLATPPSFVIRFFRFTY